MDSLNYHSFISSELRKLINKFNIILIDKGQDFERVWLVNI